MNNVIFITQNSLKALLLCLPFLFVVFNFFAGMAMLKAKTPGAFFFFSIAMYWAFGLIATHQSIGGCIKAFTEPKKISDRAEQKHLIFFWCFPLFLVYFFGGPPILDAFFYRSLDPDIYVVIIIPITLLSFCFFFMAKHINGFILK